MKPLSEWIEEEIQDVMNFYKHDEAYCSGFVQGLQIVLWNLKSREAKEQEAVKT